MHLVLWERRHRLHRDVLPLITQYNVGAADPVVPFVHIHEGDLRHRIRRTDHPCPEGELVE
eukprot:scaffold306671_cov32-Tisochrysis_lutea.AAC.5